MNPSASHWPLRRVALVGGWLLAVVARPAAANEVMVPLRFDHEFIRRTLLAQLYTGPRDQAVVWDDGTGCGFVKLREPTVTSAGDQLRIVSRGEARIGTPVADLCLTPVQWEGFLEVFETPRLSADQRSVEFRIATSNIYDNQWQKGLLTGKLWDAVKQYVQPRLESVHIELQPVVDEVRGLLPTVVASSDTARIEAMLTSLHLATAAVSDTGVTIMLVFTLPAVTPGPALATTTPEPTFSAAELRHWEESWQRWDAFLTFVVKHFGRDNEGKELRQKFLEVLLDARHDILEALAPTHPTTADPVPALFLSTWERLAPAVRNAADALPASVALRYVSFIAAGDALAAVQQLGSEIGVEITADGLRRLARIVAPASTDDPLAYSTAIDPEMRQLFGFGPPLPDPALPPEADEDQISWWRRLLAPAAAQAASEQPPAKTLERWLATRDGIDAYVHAVRAVLDDALKKTLASHDLAPRYHQLYTRLVLATAWQESCWRQFVRVNNKITYLRSPVGSSGMMQINERVWRGVYDLRGLRWDIRYNGRAGAEILMYYLQDYAIARKEDTYVGGLLNLARATYAVYNGGPGHLTRYRTPKKNTVLARIDELFYEKFRAVSAGKELQVAHCIVGGDA